MIAIDAMAERGSGTDSDARPGTVNGDTWMGTVYGDIRTSTVGETSAVARPNERVDR